MKILMLSDFYPPTIGGLERHVMSLCEGLRAKGHEVIVATMEDGDPSGSRDQNSLRIVRLRGFFQRIPFLFRDSNKKYHPPIQDRLITAQLGKLIAEIRPDIIHAHGWILYSVLSLREKYGLPLIATIHDYGLICPKKSFTRKKGEICSRVFSNDCIVCGLDTYNLPKSLFSYLGTRLSKKELKRVDKFIAVSQYVQKVYSACLQLGEKEITVIPNFYTIEKNFETKTTTTFPEDFVLFVGVLAPSKGVDLLIEAYKTLETKTKLLLIGSKHAAYSYRSSGNIIVMENLPHEAVLKACAACRFLIAPAISPEACPTVVMEAMNFKKAVIASDLGALREIVADGVTGVLFPSLKKEELARAIRLLLDNPEKAKRMGENGYCVAVNRFSFDSVLPRIENLYRQFVNPTLKDDRVLSSELSAGGKCSVEAKR